ncbi:unnamed protein product [Mycena citricolor]|uniref:MFS general substrate transporter n=1 Tax=Mycena citricolor TaxID=2018698 RepID=A0AAD2K7M3_9AGAR|nr:unnamed protein product [Mycena citricolor]
MPKLVSTVVDYLSHRQLSRYSSRVGFLSSSEATSRQSTLPTRANSQDGDAVELHPVSESGEVEPQVPDQDPELRLPPLTSVGIMLGSNALMQFAFFVTVSSAALYAEHLGGSALFSGLTIGIPTVFSGLALIPLTRYDEGRYTRPLIAIYLSLFIGSIFHALAYKANFLYLILIGRIVAGFGFTGFMYSKRYCSDPRIIGVRRRTTLASYLVLGQAFGFSAGPFIGGLLYKVGFPNDVFNGYTSPGWVTAFVTLLFATVALCLFQDVGKPQQSGAENGAAADPPRSDGSLKDLTREQWGVIASMCWTAMTCFFVLGSWESNIPIFTAVSLGYSPYAAGNFIALGGVATLPFLLLNIRFAPRYQDRSTLALGSVIGTSGLLLALILLATDRVVFASLFICWFLVALGFNIASTCTVSLLSKQLPNAYNGRTSLAVQYSNYTGRVTGAILGGAGVQMGMKSYVGVQLAVVGIGAVLHALNWQKLKAKTG